MVDEFWEDNKKNKIIIYILFLITILLFLSMGCYLLYKYLNSPKRCFIALLDNIEEKVSENNNYSKYFNVQINHLDDKLLTSNIYFNENKIYFDIPNDNYYYKVLDNKISKIFILRIINILKDNLKKEYFLEENSNQNIIIFQLKDNTLKEYLDNVINSLKKDQEFINDYKKYQDKTNSEIYLELDNYKEIIINNLKSLNIKTIINNKEVEEIKITLDILNYGNINIELIDDLISIYNQEYKIILKENESYNPFNNIDFSITIDINTLNEDEINIIKNKLINN